jgi:hypothetical protein
VSAHVSQGFNLGTGQFRLLIMLQQPIFSIDPQDDVEHVDGQRRHRVYSGRGGLITEVFNAGLTEKFNILLSSDSSCSNGSFGHADGQVNQACPA